VCIRRIILSSVICCAISLVSALADTLHLRDGRVIEADEVWERDGEVWYRQRGMISSVAKSDLLRVKRLSDSQPASNIARETALAIKPQARASASDARPPSNITRRVARVVLTDGTRIDADAVWEAEGSVGYRLGAMHAFVERGAVARVERDVTPDAPAAERPTRGLRFTTGHGGLDRIIARNASAQGVDPLLIYLVMRQESGFNHRAVSRAGARGLMQLMPATAARLGVRNIHDPAENVGAGTRYLRSLLDRFGDVRLALAAYNAGEDAVARYGNRVPPYRETVNYVRRIGAAYARAAREE
jgi:soluble lytic murein transglycosylase-like protein